jgi:tRNA dimethylallyltransferase
MPARAGPSAILIAGPTASGKSALATAIAARIGGVVVNADSMQVYREIPILSAQPSAEEQERVPHRLYGHVPAQRAYSAGRFVADVRAVLDEARRERWCPIVVGGTGLYVRALTDGLSPVPPVPDAVRERWRARAAQGETLWDELNARDPEMAARLMRGDIQRIVRALEVLEATGRSLASWQTEPGPALFDTADVVRLVVRRERQALQRRCDARFDAMLAAGALDEVAALVASHVPADRPAMKALGVQPLAAYLVGALSRDDAVAQAKADTRRYVKRQETWIRKFMADWEVVSGDEVDALDVEACLGRRRSSART